MFKRFLAVMLAILCLAGLGGCGTAADETPKKARLTIVTSFYPIYIETLRLTKDVPGVKVICLTKPQTGCLHDYQLTPENGKTLERADLFFVNGAGMESFLDKVRAARPDLPIVDASRDLPILLDEHGHANPHVWVSIPNAIHQVYNLTGPLIAADPDHAELYRTNAQRYTEQLQALYAKMTAALQGSSQPIVTTHEAFSYFARDFGLTVAATIQSEPGIEPSPREVEATIRTMKESGAKVIFTEPQYNAKTADTIARAVGAKVYSLDPIVTGELTDAADSYLTKMEANCRVLEEALR